MTIQEAKQELNSLKNLSTYLQKVKSQRDELWSKFTAIKSIDYGGNGGFGGAGKPDDRVCAVIDKLHDLENDLTQAYLTAQTKELELTDRIMSLSYPYSELLLRRYVENQTYEKIAYEMSYTFNYVVRRAMPIAIRKFAEK